MGLFSPKKRFLPLAIRRVENGAVENVRGAGIFTQGWAADTRACVVKIEPRVFQATLPGFCKKISPYCMAEFFSDAWSRSRLLRFALRFASAARSSSSVGAMSW